MKKHFLVSVQVLVLAVCISMAGLGLATAHAASGGLTISPTAIDKEIAPGATYKAEILVINQGELDINYRVYATPYSVTGEEYKPYFSPIKGATDITKWFTLGSNGGSLKIGNQDTIPVTISIPKGIGAGSYYGTVFAETEDKGTNGVITRKRVGTVVYIRVSGTATEKGSVESWSVPWLQKAPLQASVKVANEGSVHFQSKVSVTISDVFGGSKFTYEREPKILPQKLRNVPVEWQDGARFGLFKVTGKVQYLGKTQKLSTHYIFIANTPMRVLTVGLFALFVTAMVFVGRKRVARK